MASNVVRVSVLADAKDFERGFGRATGKAAGFGAAIGTMAGTVALQLGQRALGAVKDFVGGSIDSFNTLNESLNALEVVYGENADGIKAIGEEAADSLGVSNSKFNGFAVSISAFVQQIAEDEEDVVGTVDDLSGRISDFASVMDMEFGEAADKFRSGLAGESEPLRKFGIDVSAAKIETVALNTGIWDGVDAMTEGEKVQARYEAIMEQTADTTGDFARTADEAANKERIKNAELEDQKALLGESLIPLQNQWLDIQREALPAIGELATAVGRMTGALSEADLVIKSLGDDTTNVQGALDSLRKDSINPLAVFSGVGLFHEIEQFVKGNSLDEMTEGFEEWINKLDPTEEEMEGISRQLETMRDEGDLTKEEYEAFADILDLKVVSALTDQEQAARDAFAANREYKGGMEEVEEQTEETTSALERHIEILQDHHDEVRGQMDPLFALRDAQKDVEEAQDAVNEAIKEHGEGSDEHIDALAAQSDALLDLEQANIDLRATGGLTRREFVNQQVQLGHTRAAAETLADKFEDLEGFRFRPKIISLQTKLDQSGVPPSARGLFGAAGMRFHEGVRRVPGARGQEVPAILEGGEQVISADDVDRAEKAQRTRKGATQGVNGRAEPQTVIQLNINASRRQTLDGWEIIEALQKIEQSSGPLPIRVRST